MTGVDLAALHASFRLRQTPETVAGLILSTGGDLPKHLARSLTRVAKASTRWRYGWTSLSDRFHGPAPMDAQITKACELAKAFLNADLSPPEHDLYDFIAAFSQLMGRRPGAQSFRYDRMNRAERAAAGLVLSRRRYDKLFRKATRLERQLSRRLDEGGKLRMVLVGKAALAPELSLEELHGRLPAAAFVAYLAARMKMRSEFTIEGQQRPFDEVASELLEWCEADPQTPWAAVAAVFPREDVLARLTHEERGRLLGRWFDILQVIADRLDGAQRRSRMDLVTMVVRRGDDSSTWNTLAGAWNRARDHWMAFVVASGMQDLFGAMLPGKVMRLMAGDVAAWHRHAGGGLHPDTKIWNDLPFPWLVLRGEARCGYGDVEAACRRHSVNGEQSGWLAPRSRRAVAEFRPTPELVHGVTVANPFMADALRRLGFFSGKALKLPS